MRLPFLVAMLAITGSCGFAVAVPMLDARPVETPPLALPAPAAPVLVLDEAPIAALATATREQGEDILATAARVLTLDAPERVDRLPRYLLLPDGALVADAILSEDARLARGVALREPPARVPEPAHATLPLPA
ncbi:MAG TPA: hypothetical protein VM582_04205, partial [Candidatus Thermoplasmatota archaeon]|nr:hypothetical protein [Candidatus Thermoplasmatota archaeon]